MDYLKSAEGEVAKVIIKVIGSNPSLFHAMPVLSQEGDVPLS